jgi:hypothetical protein
LQWTLYMLSVVAVSHGKNTNHAIDKSTNVTSLWLKKLYNEVSWARYILRILQFPIAVDAAINDRWTTQALQQLRPCRDADSTTSFSPQRIYIYIGKVLSYSMVAYSPLGWYY